MIWRAYRDPCGPARDGDERLWRCFPAFELGLIRRLTLEVVSHCWNYAHLLVYLLSSLVLNPPRTLDVRMTVFHALEDQRTVALLRQFSERKVSGIEWNWQVLEPQRLMRRSIRRNLAAKGTTADWI